MSDTAHTYQDVIDGVDPSGLVDAVVRAVAIPSIGGTSAEVEAQQFFADQWSIEGLEVDTWHLNIDELSQRPDFCGMEVDRSHALAVLARLPGSGSGPTLALLGHTDVVPPGDLSAWSSDPFTPVVRDGCVYGRGAADMKAGLIAAWFALRMLRQAHITLLGDVVLAAVSGEEDGGLGTYALLDALPTRYPDLHIDACVIPEPTDLDIVPANGGALTFRLVIRGAATHASRRSEGVSAIEKFTLALSALTELESARNSLVDPLMQRWPIAYPLSIGTVRAGDWASTVPDLCVAEGRLGVALDETPAHARAELEATISALCEADPWLSTHPMEVQWWGGQFAPGRTDAAHPLITTVRSAHGSVTGLTPHTYGAPYGSDLRLLVGAGIPTLQYGPGDSRVAHAPDEHVAIADIVTCARTLAIVAMETCGVAD